MPIRLLVMIVLWAGVMSPAQAQTSSRDYSIFFVSRQVNSPSTSYGKAIECSNWMKEELQQRRKGGNGLASRPAGSGLDRASAEMLAAGVQVCLKASGIEDIRVEAHLKPFAGHSDTPPT